MYCFSFLLSGLGNSNVPVVFEPQTGSKSIKKGHSYRTHFVLIIIVTYLEGLLSVQSLTDVIRQRDQGLGRLPSIHHPDQLLVLL